MRRSKWTLQRSVGSVLVLLGLSLLLWPALHSVWAQENRTPAGQPTRGAGQKAPRIAPRGLLYRIERDGQRAWLFGSIHVGKADFYPLDSQVEQVLRGADAFVFEVDPGKAFELSTEFQRRFGRRAGEGLPPPLEQRLDAVYERLGLGRSEMSLWNAAGQALRLSYLQMSVLGFDGRASPDAYIAHLGRRRDLPMAGLESVEEQLDVLAPMVDSGDSLLDLVLRRIEDGTEADESLAMVDAWKDGNVTLLQYMQDRSFSVPTAQPGPQSREWKELGTRMREALLCHRNRQWVPRIASGTEQWRDPVYVVGAMHLVGDCSLTLLLAAEGWTVVRRDW